MKNHIELKVRTSLFRRFSVQFRYISGGALGGAPFATFLRLWELIWDHFGSPNGTKPFPKSLKN